MSRTRKGSCRGAGTSGGPAHPSRADSRGEMGVRCQSGGQDETVQELKRHAGDSNHCRGRFRGQQHSSRGRSIPPHFTGAAALARLPHPQPSSVGVVIQAFNQDDGDPLGAHFLTFFHSTHPKSACRVPKARATSVYFSLTAPSQADWLSPAA